MPAWRGAGAAMRRNTTHNIMERRMNLSPEACERVARVCYEAQRALRIADGISEMNLQDVPRTWVLAMESDKEIARARVKAAWAEPELDAATRAQAGEEDLIFLGIAHAMRLARGRGQRAENGGQRSEGRRQRSEERVAA